MGFLALFFASFEHLQRDLNGFEQCIFAFFSPFFPFAHIPLLLSDARNMKPGCSWGCLGYSEMVIANFMLEELRMLNL